MQTAGNPGVLFRKPIRHGGVLAALYRRERTGTGDHIDASIQETLATQEHIIRLWANEKEIVKRAGSQHASVAPAKIFRCHDGFVYLYVTRQHWKLLLDLWNDHPPIFDAPEWLSYEHRRSTRGGAEPRQLKPSQSEYASTEITGSCNRRASHACRSTPR